MYGRKKKALMPSFPFDGDEHTSDGRRKRSAYSRLPREPTIAEKPFLENDIHDDGAAESDNWPEKGGRIDDRDQQSRDSQIDGLNKPLPELPEPLWEGCRERALGTRTILSSKSANTRLRLENANEGLAKQNPTAGKIDKRLISAPLRQNPVSYPNRVLQHEINQQIVQDLDNKRYPKTLTSIADAEELELRINNLIASASSNDTGKTGVGDGLPEGKDLGRPRRLRRGKEVFAKVRDVITDKFSPNSGKCSATRAKGGSLSSNSLGQAQGRDFDGGEELDTNALLKRRIAEERNHSNYKAQFLTGVGSSIRRKPLPIYDSMNTTGADNVLPEDPFSDDHEVGNANHKGYSAVPPKTTSSKSKRKSRLLNSLGVLPTTSQTSRESKFVDATSPRSGRSVSLEIFPTSPQGYSTPKVRLEPSYDPNGRKKLAAFSFEEGEEPLEVNDAKLDKRVSSISLKRKGEEREVGLGVTAKKAKRKTISKDIENLAGRLGNLRTSASADLACGHRGGVVAIGLDLLSVRRSRTVKGRSVSGARETKIVHGSPTVVSDDVNDESVIEEPQALEAVDDVDVDELQMDIPEHRLGAQRDPKLV